MSDSFYSFSEPLNRGIDFYQADAADVTIDINSSVTLTVSSYQIRLASITIASNSELISNSYKIAYAAANLAVDGATVIIATERQDGDVVISAEVLVETNITKIAYASVSLSADSNSDGHLTLDELKAFCTQKGWSLTDADFAKMDVNADGKVDLNEWLKVKW
jgi:hypothetical protein